MSEESPLFLDVTVTLNNGLKMPRYSFGTWKLDAALAFETVSNAIASGFRHVDCARIYQNEVEVGNALEKAISEGKVTRDQLWITSKLWPTDFHPDEVEAACRRTIADLKVGVLDLYLLHWPVTGKHVGNGLGADLFPTNEAGALLKDDSYTLQQTWKKMEELVQKGLVKSIGISNFSTAQAKNILEVATIKPVCNQVELHAALPQTQLRKDMAELGIAVQSYSPLGYGVSTEKSLMDDEAIQKLAAKAGLKPAAFLLSYVASLPNVVLLTKSQTLARIHENAALRVPRFSPELVAEIEEYSAKNQKRTVNPDFFGAKKGDLFFTD